MLLVASAALPFLSFAQTPDDPFYDWDIELYRLLRSPEDPSGGILPLPDPPCAQQGIRPRGAALWVEAAAVDSAVAAPEGDGRRIRDGVRARAVVGAQVAFPLSVRIDLAGRLLAGDGRRSGGQWLDRSLFWSRRGIEIRLGLTRSSWGDGTTGSLLLGRTSPPLEMVRVRSVRPWKIPYTRSIGRVHASLFLAYLDDRYRTVPYPLLHGTRVEWEPSDWLRLIAARTILFGGVGRTEKLRLSDLWDIWWAQDENLVGDRPVSDTDQKASFAAEIRLPGRVLPFHRLQGARFFYEYAGEDSFEGLLPTAVAHQIGGSVAVDGWVGMVEFTETTDDSNWWYTWHNVYGDRPYFFRGYVMGHPMGADGRSGLIRIFSPQGKAVRAQVVYTRRGHWDRSKRAAPLWGWEDSIGLRVLRGLKPRVVLEAGWMLTRSTGDLYPLPDPAVPWLLTLAVHSRQPTSGPWRVDSPGVR